MLKPELDLFVLPNSDGIRNNLLGVVSTLFPGMG